MPTPSSMLALGTEAPAFSLTEVGGGDTITLDSAKDARALLIFFLCPHCPYVIHVEKELAALGREYKAKGVAVFAVCSNDEAQYPEDGPDGMRQQAVRLGFEFPYLHDADQTMARDYHAACTPDFFLFDGTRKLVYRGRLDGSRPNSGVPVTGAELREALDAVLANRLVAAEQQPSLGCNIKWK